jgi:hypothetical protein
VGCWTLDISVYDRYNENVIVLRAVLGRQWRRGPGRPFVKRRRRPRHARSSPGDSLPGRPETRCPDIAQLHAGAFARPSRQGLPEAGPARQGHRLGEGARGHVDQHREAGAPGLLEPGEGGCRTHGDMGCIQEALAHVAGAGTRPSPAAVIPQPTPSRHAFAIVAPTPAARFPSSLKE